jgi:hypothetical protein
MRSAPRRHLAFCLLAIVTAGACVTRTVPADVNPVAPTLVIEQFMRAVNANDLDAMARLFGTRDGSVLRLDPRRQVEERMFAIASVLRHQDYVFDGDAIIPGRQDEAVQIMVRVTTPDQTAVVPFTMVNARGNWLVEQIGLERLTNPRAR